ncbi:sulfatase-like hydrolase/transferase [Saccharicrinis sp. 156]|uniref:sulfatase-like hydrolase/transferase n=1 Tax=Saccharicrinis sp. 156 TaxID=3417574 RepID=UPI003D34BCD0
MQNVTPIYLCLFGLLFFTIVTAFAQSENEKPNIILIYVDDMGYNDLGCYGAIDPGIKTPNIDLLAAKGIRFTNYLSASNVCSPSRGAVLTGRYPQRNGLPVTPGPNDRPGFDLWNEHVGLPLSEITVAELLKSQGYATAAFGKWHLGKMDGFGPRQQGFDEYIGRLHNFHIGRAGTWYHNEDPVDEIKFSQAHQKLTDATIDFMERQQQNDKPFFIYLAHYLVHGPWSPNKEFCTPDEWASYQEKKGKMNPKIFPAMVRELDYHVGLVLQKLEELNIGKETMVILASDNGPWLPAGSAFPFSGGKYQTQEGGHRVPAIIRWPAGIPAEQVSDQLVSALDILPTIAAATKTLLPTDRKYDGYNLLPMMSGKEKLSPRKEFAYYNGLTLEAVRQVDWKLHLPRDPDLTASCVYWAKRRNKKLAAPMLNNLQSDKAEKIALDDQKKINELEAMAEIYREELGDWNRNGTNRPKSTYPGNLNTREVVVEK